MRAAASADRTCASFHSVRMPEGDDASNCIASHAMVSPAEGRPWQTREYRQRRGRRTCLQVGETVVCALRCVAHTCQRGLHRRVPVGHFALLACLHLCAAPPLLARLRATASAMLLASERRAVGVAERRSPAFLSLNLLARQHRCG